MRENNDMEILMRLKMEEFLVEPAPSDWQAIYEQLHPKKKRRFLWWWLPLAAGLSLFGAYWILFGGQNKTAINQPQPITETRNTQPDTKTSRATQPSPKNSDTKLPADHGSISLSTTGANDETVRST